MLNPNRIAKEGTAHAVVRNSVLSVGLSIICSACGASDNSRSALKHDAAKPVRNSLAWNWRDVSDAEYSDVMAVILGIPQNAILPSTHELTERVQSWVDRIDTTMRSRHADELANVPKPRAKVITKADPNAFVAPVPSCYDVPVRFGDSVSPRRRSGSSVSKVIIESRLGSVQPWESGAPCIDGASTQDAAETLQQLVARFNASSPNGCKFSIASDGALIVGKACEVDSSLGSVSGADGIVLLQTANHVTVHSGILSMMSEAAFASVLTHELGHYYRAHVTAHEADYGFFYTQTPEHIDHRPQAEPKLAELGTQAVKATEVLDRSTYFVKVEGQQLRSNYYFLVGSLVAKSRTASPACKAAYVEATSYSFEDTMGMFPIQKDLKPGQAEAYLAFESAALACLKTLKFGGSMGFAAGSGYSWASLKDLAAKPTWPKWLADVTPDSETALAELNLFVADSVGASSAESVESSVADAVLKLNRSLESVEDHAVTVLEKAHEERLGQYTYEQEADDFAVEVTAKIGLDPVAVTDAMRSLGKGQQSSLHGMSLGEKDCEKLMKNKWHDADGQYVFVPVGGFVDPHHSICYRIFNIDREVSAHKVVKANVKLPAYDDHSWKDLQREADRKGIDFLDEDKGSHTNRWPSVAATLRRFGKLSCLFDSSH
ncbi:MAG: hypothetical protein FJ146_08235 [Deltaproteobacteria bacterium]|nr:hypothetical protein [Deltaproteobacteria bacterium]